MILSMGSTSLARLLLSHTGKSRTVSAYRGGERMDESAVVTWTGGDASVAARQVRQLSVLTVILMMAGVLGAVAGWTVGFIHGYQESESTRALAAELRPAEVTASASWVETLERLDRWAASIRPDLDVAHRQWLVLLLLRASHRWGVDPELVMSVAVTESGLRQDAVSPRGAVGVMQVMPATARAYGADPYDTIQNIEVGVRYLSELLARYRGDVQLALAAYNAGPSRVRNSVPAIRETRNYVRRVVETYRSR